METKISKTTIILIAFLIVSTIIGILIFNATKPTPEKIARRNKLDQVEFKKDQSSVTVNRSGQVTIKTPDKTIMQYWDKNKIDQLFAKLDQLDASRFTQTVGKITIDLNNTQELAFITEEIINSSEFEEILRILEESNSSLATDPLPSSELPQASYTATIPENYPSEPERQLEPSPQPLYPSASTNPTASQEPFRCSFEEPEEGKENFVVSETVCSEMLD